MGSKENKMNFPPYRIPRTDYRGSNLKKREKLRDEDRLCALIEQELKKRYDAMKIGDVLVVISAELAHKIGRDPEMVRALIFRIDCGHNGVTFHKQREDRT